MCVSLQSDFLDFYVLYLKELPECLSVISILASSSLQSSAFMEVMQKYDVSGQRKHRKLLSEIISKIRMNSSNLISSSVDADIFSYLLY